MQTAPVIEPVSAQQLPSDGSLLRRFRTGNPGAAEQLYQRYSDRVRTLVRTNVSRALSRRLDADDIVQSVFRRFFEAARQGRYLLPAGEELWNLLMVIILNRLRSEEQFHR